MTRAATIPEASPRSVVSLRTICGLFGITDRGDLAAKFAEAGIVAEDGPNRSKLYPLKGVCRLLAQGDDLSPSARNQIAQAEYRDAQRAVLEREWRPLAEIAAAGSAIGKAITRVIEDCDLGDDERESIMGAIREAVEPFLSSKTP